MAVLSLLVATSGLAQTPPDTDLRLKVARQQEEIDELRASLREQRGLLDQALAAVAIRGNPAVAAAPLQPAPSPAPKPAAPLPAAAPAGSPFTIHAGPFDIAPGGFFDFGSVFRSTNAGTGTPTNYGSIPFSNTPAGQVTETRFSAQNTRLTLRLSANFGKTAFAGYLETDFLGALPTNGYVASNAAPPRMRLGYFEIRRGKWDFVAGQTYGLLTPNRTGISASPRDVFLTQAADPNFHLGLNWTRSPQVRVVYHPNTNWSLGLAAENPEQYIGGAVTLPAALSASYATQLDNGTVTSTPNAVPDILPKVAWDGKLGGKAAHWEATGLIRTFRVYNPLSTRTFAANGFGGSVNGMLGLTSKLRLTTNLFWSDGGGRHTFA